jgi:hypothetical protein
VRTSHEVSPSTRSLDAEPVRVARRTGIPASYSPPTMPSRADPVVLETTSGGDDTGGTRQ